MTRREPCQPLSPELKVLPRQRQHRKRAAMLVFSLLVHACGLAMLAQVAIIELADPLRTTVPQQISTLREERVSPESALPPKSEPLEFPDVQPENRPLEVVPPRREPVIDPPPPEPEPVPPPPEKVHQDMPTLFRPTHSSPPVLPPREPEREKDPKPPVEPPSKPDKPTVSPAPKPATAVPPVVVPPRRMTDNSKPAYPRRARERGYEGDVTVRALVGTDGVVKSAEITESSGFSILDKAALKAVEDWAFTPGKRDGQVEEAYAEVTIRFKLTEN